MKIWTYAEMVSKLEVDLDLEDETFISADELAGYFNEATSEAESEIIELNQDYLLTKSYLPVTPNVQQYTLPYNIYANKIRGLMYINGATIYEVRQFRRQNKFENLAFTDQYPNASDDYGYMLVNDIPGQAILELHPLVRDTAILAPKANLFTPFTLWYLRNCARVPMIGEFCNPEIIYPTQVTGNTIQTAAGTKVYGIVQQGVPGAYPGSIALKTGDKIHFNPAPGGTVPGGLVAGTTYYAIALGSGLISVALSLANALGGTAIVLTTPGTVYFRINVACTTAIRDATLIDIPEFATFIIQWVKCRCLEKESDARLSGAVTVLEGQKKQMVDTLTKGIDDDTVQADFRHYWEMN